MTLLSSNKDIPLDSQSIFEIARNEGTPYYLYDADILRMQAAAIKETLGSDTSLFFASFCNSNPHLLEILKESKIGILASSPAELKLAHTVGFTTDNIAITGSPYSEDELKLFLDKKLHINLDSISQLAKVGELSRGARVGIRVNLTSCVSSEKNLPINACVGVQSRVGLLEQEIPLAIQVANEYDLKIVTLHAYTGTNQLSDVLLLRGLDALLQLATTIPELEYINLGGGFGITYGKNANPFPWESFHKESLSMLDDFKSSTGRNIKLQFEPGRILVAPSGFLVAEVLDVKERTTGEIFIATNTSLSNFPRPYIYGMNGQHDVSIIHMNPSDLDEYKVTICGNALASGDRLAESVLVIGKPQIGDLVVIHDAGAYGYSMSSQFSGRLRPSEILRSGSVVTRIRDRERFDEILVSTRYDSKILPEQTNPDTLSLLSQYYASETLNNWIFDNSENRNVHNELTLFRNIASTNLSAALMLSQRHAAMVKIKGYCPSIDVSEFKFHYENSFFITQAISLLNSPTSSNSHVTATSYNDGYKLNGSYPWVTGYELAEKIVLGIRTDEHKEALFLVDAKSPGLSSSIIENLDTLEESKTVTLHFRDVFVSKDQLLYLASTMDEKILFKYPNGKFIPVPSLHSIAIAIGVGLCNIENSKLLLDSTRGDLASNIDKLSRDASVLFDELTHLVQSQSEDISTYEDLRAKSNAFAIRCNKLLCILSRGRGLLSNTTANKLARECQFLLAWGMSARSIELTAKYLVG